MERGNCGRQQVPQDGASQRVSHLNYHASDDERKVDNVSLSGVPMKEATTGSCVVAVCCSTRSLRILPFKYNTFSLFVPPFVS